MLLCSPLDGPAIRQSEVAASDSKLCIVKYSVDIFQLQAGGEEVLLMPKYWPWVFMHLNLRERVSFAALPQKSKCIGPVMASPEFAVASFPLRPNSILVALHLVVG